MIFMKQHVGDLQLHNNEEAEVACCKWLWMQEPDFCHSMHFELMSRWNKCISVLSFYVEAYWDFIEVNERHVMFSHIVFMS